jgi:hypothetical protein
MSCSKVESFLVRAGTEGVAAVVERMVRMVGIMVGSYASQPAVV